VHYTTLHARKPSATARVQVVLADSATDNETALALTVTLDKGPQWTVDVSTTDSMTSPPYNPYLDDTHSSD
jgi:hypothetical protein